jgi:hypothetical protein
MRIFIAMFAAIIGLAGIGIAAPTTAEAQYYYGGKRYYKPYYKPRYYAPQPYYAPPPVYYAPRYYKPRYYGY